MAIKTYRDAYASFDEFLDSLHGAVTIAGMEFDTARALKELDEIAYREMFWSWLDSERIDPDDLED